MLLQLEGVSKSFGGVTAVRDVSVTVAEGEIVGLIGPNGSGKTTLFNLITGFARPDRGQIRLRGKDITGAAPQDVCRHGIARTFQIVRPFPHLTVLQNVAVGRAYGRAPARDRRQAERESYALLEEVGLAGRSHLLATKLTLVERKRLEVARALATRPVLLLLDELLAGLNPTEVVAGLNLIRRIRASGVTVLVVEHLVKALFALCDRVIVLDAGELIADGPPAQVAGDPRVIDAYLGVAQHA